MYDLYCKQGFYIFPCNANKTPKTKHGFKGAQKNWSSWTGELIGLPTGNINKIVVIDFDIKDGHQLSYLFETMQEIGPLPDTLTIETPSGGRHLYYSVESTSLSSHVRFFDKNLPIDIRGNGGYVIAADFESYVPVDNDLSDIIQSCAKLPSWIEQYKKKSVSTDETDFVLPKEEIREIRSSLNYIDSDDRDLWIRVGMALKNTMCKSARGLWDEWSQKSDKYDPKDQDRTWKSFNPNNITIASIFHEAKQAGWETTYEKDTIKPVIIEETKQKEPAKKMSFPKNLLNPPGVVGEFVDFINSKSIKEQPILALGASIAAVGSLLGRKVQTNTGIRTNIYCIGVGESGCGKEAARSSIKKLFQFSGCDEYVAVEDLASDAAIITALEETPSQVFLIDEIGRFLKVTNTDFKNPHLANIISVLLKVYSSSNIKFMGKRYADKDRKPQIDNPNLCIYGTTVPHVLYDGLTKSNINDGFLSRVILFESEDPDPPKDRTKNFLSDPPEDLIEKIKFMRDMPVNVEGKLNVNPVIVDMTKDAENMLFEFDDYIYNLRRDIRKDGQNDAIYNRTAQTAEQISLIIGSGRNLNYPCIDIKDMEYGINLAKHLSDYLLYITERYISENDIEYNVKRVFDIISKSNGISMSQLTRKTQDLSGHRRNDIINTLLDGCNITFDFEGDGKRKKKVFYPIKNIF